jgi:hypothetical protein
VDAPEYPAMWCAIAAFDDKALHVPREEGNVRASSQSGRGRPMKEAIFYLRALPPVQAVTMFAQAIGRAFGSNPTQNIAIKTNLADPQYEIPSLPGQTPLSSLRRSRRPSRNLGESADYVAVEPRGLLDQDRSTACRGGV